MSKNKVSALLNEYFNSSVTRDVGISFLKESTVPSELPLKVDKTSRWKMVDEPTQMLVKTFKFDNHRAVTAFVGEVLEYEYQIQHHGKILIEGLEVTIEVFTHRVNLVTELDLEYSKSVSEIRDDIEYYGERP